MSNPVLVCFAVPAEARFFTARDVRTLITGIGRKSAEAALRKALASVQPSLVLSCGFAGGLNPELPAGAVVFDADQAAGLEDGLTKAGAHPARFHCVDRVATTVAEKRRLRDATGADAVEMESAVLRALCRERHLPSATVRAISDTASEDLPLDFNALMTPRQKLSYVRLAGALVAAPGKIAALRRLQRQTTLAAKNLARVLAEVIAG